jgi:hypothetical protein
VKLSEYKLLKDFFGIYYLGSRKYTCELSWELQKNDLKFLYDSHGFKIYQLQKQLCDMNDLILESIKTNKILNFINKLFRIVK